MLFRSHCGNGDCHSGGCDSGDSDSDYGNGITAEALVQLNKALYGLNQASRLWYKDINGFPRSLGFTQPHSDRNMYSLYAKVLVKTSVRHLPNTTLQQKFIYYTTTTSRILFKIELQSL